MPSKNIQKLYIQNGYYHLYNRGVEKRLIFEDKQDYNVFINYLSDYLLPKNVSFLNDTLQNPNTSRIDKQKTLRLLRLNNFSDSIELLAFCLMPNHFHFLLKQTNPRSIDIFMNSICTRYTMYFNRKHKRVGRLYQDVYKGVNIDTDEYLLQLSRYIHLQATHFSVQGDPLFTQPSSLRNYLNIDKSSWVKCNEVLAYFHSQNPQLEYLTFIKQANEEIIGELTLEE